MITKEEARQLIAAAVEPHIKVFITLALSTTARTSAILERKWSDVDWTSRRIDFGAGHGNKRRTIVPLNDMAVASLKAAKELACGDHVVEFRGKPVLSIKSGFRAACKRAGLEDVSPHILRHSAATWMMMDGVPLREIAKMLGDSEKTVEKVYGKHAPDYLRDASRALDLKPALKIVGGRS